MRAPAAARAAGTLPVAHAKAASQDHFVYYGQNFLSFLVILTLFPVTRSNH